MKKPKCKLCKTAHWVYEAHDLRGVHVASEGRDAGALGSGAEPSVHRAVPGAVRGVRGGVDGEQGVQRDERAPALAQKAPNGADRTKYNLYQRDYKRRKRANK
jgi:hypothetical protein